MLSTLTSALLLLLKLFSLYFFAIALFALKRRKPVPVSAPATRFACLIAARNEEAVIASLVNSLRQQSYPPELCDIYVIPNNCTDRTEAAARDAGARIFRCLRPVRCKGDTLREAVERLLPLNYDAFCVFDADNLVHPEFLARMNDALLAGAQVCKGAMRVKNPKDGPLAGCYGLYFTLFDLFYSRARMNCGLSAKLVGTGFAVRREVLERLGGWRTETIAEDAEFAALCARHGIRIHYVPEAVTWDEAPVRLTDSLRQRRRWCSGLMDVADSLRPPLCRAVRGRGGILALDSLLMLHTPYVQVCSALLTLFSLFTLPGAAARALLALPLLYILCVFASGVLACAGRYHGRAAVSAALAFPLFMASWLPLQMVSVLLRTQVWHPIRHGSSISA